MLGDDYRFQETEDRHSALCIEEQLMARVKTFKLLGLWMDDNPKWESNTEHIIKKVAKRLYLLKTLKSYSAPKNDLKTF